jgi:hypothetical protein
MSFDFKLMHLATSGQTLRLLCDSFPYQPTLLTLRQYTSNRVNIDRKRRLLDKVIPYVWFATQSCQHCSKVVARLRSQHVTLQHIQSNYPAFYKEVICVACVKAALNGIEAHGAFYDHGGYLRKFLTIEELGLSYEPVKDEYISFINPDTNRVLKESDFNPHLPHHRQLAFFVCSMLKFQYSSKPHFYQYEEKDVVVVKKEEVSTDDPAASPVSNLVHTKPNSIRLQIKCTFPVTVAPSGKTGARVDLEIADITKLVWREYYNNLYHPSSIKQEETAAVVKLEFDDIKHETDQDIADIAIKCEVDDDDGSSNSSSSSSTWGGTTADDISADLLDFGTGLIQIGQIPSTDVNDPLLPETQQSLFGVVNAELGKYNITYERPTRTMMTTMVSSEHGSIPMSIPMFEFVYVCDRYSLVQKVCAELKELFTEISDGLMLVQEEMLFNKQPPISVAWVDCLPIARNLSPRFRKTPQTNVLLVGESQHIVMPMLFQSMRVVPRHSESSSSSSSSNFDLTAAVEEPEGVRKPFRLIMHQEPSSMKVSTFVTLLRSKYLSRMHECATRTPLGDYLSIHVAETTQTIENFGVKVDTIQKVLVKVEKEKKVKSKENEKAYMTVILHAISQHGRQLLHADQIGEWKKKRQVALLSKTDFIKLAKYLYIEHDTFKRELGYVTRSQMLADCRCSSSSSSTPAVDDKRKRQIVVYHKVTGLSENCVGKVWDPSWDCACLRMCEPVDQKILETSEVVVCPSCYHAQTKHTLVVAASDTETSTSVYTDDIDQLETSQFAQCSTDLLMEDQHSSSSSSAAFVRPKGRKNSNPQTPRRESPTQDIQDIPPSKYLKPTSNVRSPSAQSTYAYDDFSDGVCRHCSKVFPNHQDFNDGPDIDDDGSGVTLVKPSLDGGGGEDGNRLSAVMRQVDQDDNKANRATLSLEAIVEKKAAVEASVLMCIEAYSTGLLHTKFLSDINRAQLQATVCDVFKVVQNARGSVVGFTNKECGDLQYLMRFTAALFYLAAEYHEACAFSFTLAAMVRFCHSEFTNNEGVWNPYIIEESSKDIRGTVKDLAKTCFRHPPFIERSIYYHAFVRLMHTLKTKGELGVPELKQPSSSSSSLPSIELMKMKLVHGLKAITSAAGVLRSLHKDAARYEDEIRLFPKLRLIKTKDDVDQMLKKLKETDEDEGELMTGYLRELSHTPIVVAKSSDSGVLLIHVLAKVFHMASSMKQRLDLVGELAFIAYGVKRKHALIQRNHLKALLNYDRDSKQQQQNVVDRSPNHAYASALKELVELLQRY